MSHAIDHIGFSVKDYERSKAFYTQALAPLGLTLVMEFGKAGGFGRGKPELWFGESQMDFQTAAQVAVITPLHVCLTARSREEVDAFYKAALAAGGKDNGAPGIRAHYHPNYYGAFVIDPDGHNVEAVFHG
ncbi:MAG TPA: VOC family protein [Polyangiaceae bacterium]|nr:VOC family protein [Polyangiaceae bacterium]